MYQNGRKKGEVVLEIFSTVMIKRKKIVMTTIAASCRLLLVKKKLVSAKFGMPFS
jgi:predicted transcriptional regulator